MRIATALAVLLLAGCGSDELRVSAAASLKPALEAEEGVRLSFGGSDELAAQIRHGARPDVYAAANIAIPRALFREGLVERPVVFAANRLVVAVPADSPIRRVEDLAEAGMRIAMGSPSVPGGYYARRFLDGLDHRLRDAILANVRSEEPDVGGVIGKLAQGAVDAGFVYATDVRATGSRLRAIPLDAPRVLYGAAVVDGAREGARDFVARLPELARAAGFEAP